MTEYRAIFGHSILIISCMNITMVTVWYNIYHVIFRFLETRTLIYPLIESPHKKKKCSSLRIFFTQNSRKLTFVKIQLVDLETKNICISNCLSYFIIVYTFVRALHYEESRREWIDIISQFTKFLYTFLFLIST